MATADSMTMAELVETVQRLQKSLQTIQELVSNRPRLHRKDVCLRYGISEATLDRWVKKQLIPAPVRLGGPVWRTEDLEAAETAGQLPCPASG